MAKAERLINIVWSFDFKYIINEINVELPYLGFSKSRKQAPASIELLFGMLDQQTKVLNVL